MNTINQLLWSRLRSSEGTLAETMTFRGLHHSLMAGALALAMMLNPLKPAKAIEPGTLPTGGEVLSGQAGIVSNGANMTITQQTARVITQWQSFNIGQNASVTFQQPNQSSVALNRIYDQNPSQILGTLKANGQIYLINPAGIYFSKSAQVDTGALVASTLDISNEHFLAGIASFDNGSGTGSIINQGTINATNGGYVALLSPAVTNTGTITAPDGTVAMVAADRMHLDFVGDGLVNFTVDQKAVDALVQNGGLIRANSGTVLLSARAADEVTKGVVNQNGVIEANGIRNDGGRIILESDQLMLSGSLAVKSSSASGGTVTLKGREITLAGGSRIDADGASGGGTVHIGGGWQGKGEQHQATTVTMEAGSSISASANLRGKGGEIVLWSDVTNPNSLTSVAGSLVANGGLEGGNGGRIESSGHRLQVGNGARISTNAPAGKAGIWLLDPCDFTIGSDISGATLSTALQSGDIFIKTTDIGVSSNAPLIGSGASGSGGDIFVNDNVSWSANTLTLDAWRNIVINTAMNASGTAGLALKYGQGALAAGNSATIQVNAPVNLASTGSFSTTHGSDGTPVTYTIITSLGDPGSTNGKDLQGINGLLDGNYVLGSDIDAAPTKNWNGNAGFTPIANANPTIFTGTFDGLGHSITGLTINRPGTKDVALFGYISGADIRNIGMREVNITGQSFVGGLVGYNYRGTIRNAYATGNVNGTGDFVGGLVGYNSGAISNAFATVSINGHNFVGGLVGSNSIWGTINNTYASGNVTGNGEVGGLVGDNWGTITNAYATGNVNGTGIKIGGLVGENWGSINNAYASGSITGTGINVAGLIGYNNQSITNSFYDQETTGQSSGVGGGNAAGITAITTAAALTPGTYTGFNFTNTWFMIDGSTRPFLRNEWSTTITNAHQLQLMAMQPSAAYTLSNNIDLTPHFTNKSDMWATDVRVSGNQGAGFVPIGDDAIRFSGTFDGMNHTITRLTINRPGTDNVGLFGYTKDAGIQNIGLNAVDINGQNNVGGVVGRKLGGAISNSYASGTVEGQNNVGGLTGNNYNGSIANSYASGSVTGTQYVGGLTGYNDELSSITNSYASGSVQGQNNVGGLTGDNYNGSITNSFYDQDLSSKNDIGKGTPLATVDIKKLKPFTDAGWSIDNKGGANTIWRIYEGYSTPLLRSFLTPVTATVNAPATKIYDGSDLVTTGSPSHNWSAAVDNSKIIGTALYRTASKAVGSYDVLLDGIYSTQDGYDISITPGNVNITPRPLTVSITTGKTVYGSDLVTGSILFNNMVAGDKLTGTVTIATTGNISSSGHLKAGNYTGIQTFSNFSDADADNYTISSITPGDYTVEKFELTTSGFTANNKPYDTTTNVTGTGFSDNRFPIDKLDFTYNAAFGEKNAGEMRTVNYSSIAISGGADQGNYKLASTVGITTADITPVTLTVTAIDDQKTFDNQPHSGGNGVIYSGFVGGESSAVLSGDVKYGGTSQGASAIGLYTLEPSGLASGNYVFNYVNGTLEIVQGSGLADNAIASLTSQQEGINGTMKEPQVLAGNPDNPPIGPGAGSSTITGFGNDVIVGNTP